MMTKTGSQGCRAIDLRLDYECTGVTLQRCQVNTDTRSTHQESVLTIGYDHAPWSYAEPD